MIKIAICDDEKIFVDILYSHLKSIFENMYIDVQFYLFQSASSLIRAYRTHNFDILFMDIDMPVMSGFDAAKEIRNMSLYTMIVFVTSKHDLVYNSFEYNPFYFICKSSHKNLLADLTHVSEKILIHSRQKMKIEIKDIILGKQYVPVGDILYIKSEKHYLLYYLNSNNSVPIKERGKIGEKEVELLNFDFFRPHQRYLVNMNNINRFDAILNTIMMINNDLIPISKGLKSEALEKYRIFKRR